MALEAPRALSDLFPHSRCSVRRKISQFTAFSARPAVFYGIQFGCIGGKPAYGEPVPLCPEKRFGDLGAMRSQAIPEQDQFSPYMAPYVFDRLDNFVRMHRSSIHTHIRFRISTAGCTRHDTNNRIGLPATRGPNAGSLTPWRPASADRRSVRNARFIPKAQFCSHLQPFFCMRGQVRSCQRRIAFSSRSFARVSGFWQLQPSTPSIFQTWPGWYTTPVVL